MSDRASRRGVVLPINGLTVVGEALQRVHPDRDALDMGQCSPSSRVAGIGIHEQRTVDIAELALDGNVVREPVLQWPLMSRNRLDISRLEPPHHSLRPAILRRSRGETPRGISA